MVYYYKPKKSREYLEFFSWLSFLNLLLKKKKIFSLNINNTKIYYLNNKNK